MKSSKFKILEKAFCLGLILTILFSFTGFAAVCSDIPNHVLRLHVLANSDSDADQALKLKVRDRILAESADLFDGVQNRDEAEAIVSQKLNDLQAVAEDEVQKEGYDYPVKVELTNMYFSTRQYDTVILPAGFYDALRITIGSGQGRNWWCVMFPALCIPAAEDQKQLKDVLDQNEMQVVDGEAHYVVKFKTVELYEEVQNWVGGLWQNGSSDSPAQGSAPSQSTVQSQIPD